jgi:hypothetical protein
MSAACLALEVDGVTGQAFFIPFAGKAQLVIGYKGMNTLAARSGFTVQGEVVREGDDFDYELGDKGFVRHKPARQQGPDHRRMGDRIVHDRPSIISVLGIDDIMAIMAKSPGAKRSDSPWRDQAIGFPGDGFEVGKAPAIARHAPQRRPAVSSSRGDGGSGRGARACRVDRPAAWLADRGRG